MSGHESQWWQAVAEKLIAAVGHFLYLRLWFYSLQDDFLSTWDTILVILGSRGTPNGHTDAQMSVFNYFWLELGTPPEHTLGTILRFSLFGVANLGKVSRSMFLVLRGWKWCQNAMTECAITTEKQCVLSDSTFSTYSIIQGPRGDLAYILMPFGRPGVTFSDLGGSWRQAWNSMIFERFPGGGLDWEDTPKWG